MNRRSLLLGVSLIAASLLSAGCGFQPLYGSTGFSALPGLVIEAGDSRQDYMIEQALDRFLGQGRSEHRLAFETTAREQRLGVSAADRASRFALSVTTSYLLTSPAGEPVTGRITETVYFDAPQDPYALITARADAEERAADLIARSLARELAAALQRQSQQSAS